MSPQESDGASQIAAHTRRYFPATTGTSSPPEDSRVVVSPDNMEAVVISSGKIISLHINSINHNLSFRNLEEETGGGEL